MEEPFEYKGHKYTIGAFPVPDTDGKFGCTIKPEGADWFLVLREPHAVQPQGRYVLLDSPEQAIYIGKDYVIGTLLKE